MPYLSITTNAALTPEAESVLAAAASKSLAIELGKPEAYVMVSVKSGNTVRFAGSGEPAAFLAIKSIGLPRDCNKVAHALTDIVSQHAHLPANRIFVTFTDVPPAHWGHGGATFA